MKCTVTNTPKGQKMAAAPTVKAKKGDATTGFAMNFQGDTFTINGVDAQGRTVDIKDVATLTPAPTSSDPTVVAVDAPNGMSCASREARPAPAVGATSVITVIATWNDGSQGPFTLTWTDTIGPDPVTGLNVTHGPVVVTP